MQRRQFLPIPFLVLMLAGAVSLVSFAMDVSTRSGAPRRDSIQAQTVEQERLAAAYFSVLSWLSEVVPRAEKPHSTAPSAVANVAKPSSAHPRWCRIEVCKFRYTRNLAAQNRAARRIE